MINLLISFYGKAISTAFFYTQRMCPFLKLFIPRFFVCPCLWRKWFIHVWWFCLFMWMNSEGPVSKLFPLVWFCETASWYCANRGPFFQPHEETPVIILIVPTESGKPVHGGQKGEQQRGHGAFVNSLSQLCLRHASKHRLNVESKWKVCQNPLIDRTLTELNFFSRYIGKLSWVLWTFSN